MTGLLSIDDSGKVRRDLDWAQVSRGKAVPLGTMSTAALPGAERQ
jgi:outer membrane PBP1 activator LpoA protein